MRTLVMIAALMIVLFAVKLAAAVIAPVLLGLALAVAFQPLSERMARRGWPAWVTAIVTTAACLGVVVGIGAFVVQAGVDIVDSLPRYAERLTEVRADMIAWLKERGLTRIADSLGSADVTGAAQSMVESGARSFVGLLQVLTLVLVTTVFVQLEASAFRAKLFRHFRDPAAPAETARALAEVQKYLLVKGGLSLANGVLLGLWCWLWGLDNAILWGVMAFALNFVPVIGSIIAAVFPVLLAFVNFGPGTAVGVLSGYVAVNLLVDNVLEPRLMGRAVGLSPLAIVLAMLVWGFLLGPLGALLSVPLTVVVKIALGHVPEMRWLAILLDGSDETPSGWMRAVPPRRAVAPRSKATKSPSS
jgi:AI-2 transport protein TqsA